VRIQRRENVPWDDNRHDLDDKIEYSVHQAILQCRREADEEEERRRWRACEELEDVRRSFEREIEQHNRASTEALARADRMLAEQAESMEQRVEEISRRMGRERQMLEDQLRGEQEENR
jgi:glycerate-2-kinase